MSNNTEANFESPFEIATPPGGEGWKSLYPFYLVPTEDTRELDESRFWFADSMHFGHVMYPFDSVVVDAVFLACGQNSSRVFSIPTALGLDVRIVNGYVYLSPVPVTDPAEIEKRVADFQERAGHYFENWTDLYETWKVKVQACVDRMKELEFPDLPELDPIEHVKAGRGESIGSDLMESYRSLISEFFKLWQYHFEMLNLGYGAYITFFQFCKEAFPEITDQTVARMVAGIEVLAFKPDAELRRLATLAIELGLDGHFGDGSDPEGVIAALGGSEPGKKWLADLESVRDPWFNYSTEYGFYHDQPTWNQDLTVPFTGIARYIELAKNGEELTRSVDQLREDRDRLVEEYRSLLGEEEQAQFDQLLGLSSTVFPFIEEHNLFVEHWGHTAFWEKTRELAQVFVDAGYFAEVEDLYYLDRYELDAALFDLVDAWATGVEGRGVKHWEREIAERRETIEALRKVAPPPALGAAPDEITDPFAIMNYGITSERVQEWLGKGDSSGAAVKGVAGSPGQVEGIARVIRNERELDQLQPGEILVCPVTAPSWAPVFSSISAVVSDIGGMMSHAAIVCREYEIPAVVGTGFATARITTGQRIRVDGSTGEVEVLEAVPA